MKSDEEGLQRENLYLKIRPLRERANRSSHDPRLYDDIARLIATTGAVCKEDAEAVAELEVAKILLTLGSKQDALQKVRTTLIGVNSSKKSRH